MNEAEEMAALKGKWVAVRERVQREKQHPARFYYLCRMLGIETAMHAPLDTTSIGD